MFEEVPHHGALHLHCFFPFCLILFSFSWKQRQRLVMTCIYRAKRKKKTQLFSGARFYFKVSRWQLNAFVFRFFWSLAAALSVTARMPLWVKGTRISLLPLPCLRRRAVCVRLSPHPPVRARETSAFVQIFTRWQPGAWWTKNNPVLSKFVIFKAILCCFF